MAVMTGQALDDSGPHGTIGATSEVARVILRDEIKRRRISEEEFARRAGISYTWLRKIIGGEHAGPEAKRKIREALSVCTVCECKIEVPGDDVLFAVEARGS